MNASSGGVGGAAVAGTGIVGIGAKGVAVNGASSLQGIATTNNAND